MIGRKRNRMPSRRSALLSIAAAPFAAAADWPQFLGPTRNGVYPDPLNVSLKNPRLLWKKGVGAGFSSPVVVKNQLILFHRVGNKEWRLPGPAQCFAEESSPALEEGRRGRVQLTGCCQEPAHPVSSRRQQGKSGVHGCRDREVALAV